MRRGGKQKEAGPKRCGGTPGKKELCAGVRAGKWSGHNESEAFRTGPFGPVGGGKEGIEKLGGGSWEGLCGQ